MLNKGLSLEQVAFLWTHRGLMRVKVIKWLVLGATKPTTELKSDFMILRVIWFESMELNRNLYYRENFPLTRCIQNNGETNKLLAGLMFCSRNGIGFYVNLSKGCHPF